MPKEKNKVIWAIDPFESGVKGQGIKTLVRWLRKHGHELAPVFLMGKSDTRSAEEIDTKLRHYLREFGLGARAGLYRTNDWEKKWQPIDTMSRAGRAPFTLLTTHGRSRLARIILGSFAENILANSKLPVLVLPKRATKYPYKFSRILFATDFSSPSKKAFHKLVAYAKEFDCELNIFHSLVLPNAPSSGFVMGETVAMVPENYFEEQAAWAEAMARRWCKLADRVGVSCKFVVTSDLNNFSIARTALKYAEKLDAGVIAITSSSNPVASLFLGSVSAELLSLNKIPLLIYGPRTLQARVVKGETRVQLKQGEHHHA